MEIYPNSTYNHTALHALDRFVPSTGKSLPRIAFGYNVPLRLWMPGENGQFALETLKMSICEMDRLFWVRSLCIK